MIQKIITDMKNKANENLENESIKLETLASIENLLNEIDFSSEVVPTNNIDKLINLFTNLKGDPLNNIELEIVNEITLDKT
jgi:hypothetical protein